MSDDIQKIRIEELDLVSLSEVSQAHAVIDDGESEKYKKIDLKSLDSRPIRIVIDKDYLSNEDNSATLQVMKGDSILPIVDYDLDIITDFLNFSVENIVFGSNAYTLQVSNTNTSDKLITFRINVKYNGVYYYATVLYLNQLSSDKYNLILSSGTLLADGTSISTLSLYKNDELINLSESNIEYTSSYFDLSFSSIIENNITKVQVKATPKNSTDVNGVQELIKLIHLPSGSFDSLLVVYKLDSKVDLFFDPSVENTENQILYFVIAGEYQTINTDFLYTSINSGNIISVENTIHNGNKCVSIEFETSARSTLLSVKYRYNDFSYSDHITVFGGSTIKYIPITNYSSFEFNGNSVELLFRLIDENKTPIDISNGDFEVFASFAAYTKQYKSDNNDYRYSISLTDLESMGTMLLQLVYNEVTYKKEILLYKKIEDEYEIRVTNPAPIYSGEPVESIFTFYKNKEKVAYLSDNINIVSDIDDKISITHQNPTVNDMTITVDNIRRRNKYRVVWSEDGVIFDEVVIVVNIVFQATYVFDSLQKNVMLIDGQAAYIDFFLESESTLMNISDIGLTISIDGFLQEQSGNGLYRRLKLSQPSTPLENGFEAKGEVTYIHEDGTLYTTTFYAIVRNSVVGLELNTKPIFLDLKVDTNGDVLSGIDNTVVYLYQNNRSVSLSANALMVSPDVENSNISIVKSNNGDGGVLITVSNALKSCNLDLSTILNNIEYTSSIPVRVEETGSDVYTLDLDRYILTLDAINYPVVKPIGFSDSIKIKLTKNKVPLIGKTLTLNYDSSSIKSECYEIGDGLYELKISNLKTELTTIEINYNGLVFKKIEILAANIKAGGSRYNSEATDSITIASSGDLAFTVGEGYAYTKGLELRAAYDSTNYIDGIVKEYTGGVVIITANSSTGSGTYEDWKINIKGAAGATGPAGADGADAEQLEIDVTTYPTKIGVRVGNTGSFSYTTDLKGTTGLPLEFDWNGTELGVRVQGYPTYTYVDLVGATGKNVEFQKDINSNLQWRLAGTSDAWVTLYTKSQLQGLGFEYNWDGTRLGVRTEGDSSYSYTDLKGEPGTSGNIFKTSSVSSSTIGIGDKTFTVASGLAYTKGQNVVIAYDSTNIMYGLVKSYTGTTLVVTISKITGSGTYTSWDINISGPIGKDGTDGDDGADGNDGADGKTFILKGSDSVSSIYAKSGTIGDIWIATNTDQGVTSGHGLQSDGLGVGAEHWNDIGQLRGNDGIPGDKGDKGDKGYKGDDGDSTKLYSTSVSSINLSNLSYSKTGGTNIIITLETVADFIIGQNVQVIKDANNYLYGRIINISNLNLTLLIRGVVGGGTYTDWKVVASAEPGYNGDESTDTMIKNYSVEKTSTNGVLTIDKNYMIQSILIFANEQTPTLKIGSVADADDIISEQVITDVNPPQVNNTQYLGIVDANYDIHYTVSNGVVTILINTIKIR